MFGTASWHCAAAVAVKSSVSRSSPVAPNDAACSKVHRNRIADCGGMVWSPKPLGLAALSPMPERSTLNPKGPAVLAAMDCKAVLQERSGSWLPGVSTLLCWSRNQTATGSSRRVVKILKASEEFCMNIRDASQSNLRYTCWPEVASMTVMND